MMAKEVMDINGAAAYLGVSKAWLYRACKEGHIPHVRFGRKYRFFKGSLDEWMREGSFSRLQVKLGPPKASSSSKRKPGKKPEA